MATHRHRDRLSALPAEALARILSHLPSDEAARASTLSRPWRRVSYSVPVVHLVDGKILSQSRRGSGRYFLPVCFDQQVTSAVLSKDPGTPIRAFRLQALDAPADMLDQWILIAATSGAEDIDVELRYRSSSRRTICPFGRSARASADFGNDVRGLYTKTPRQLFRCDTLRRLCLTNWTLDLPAGGILVAPPLHTLRLKRIMAPGAVIQRLVDSCENLADLTLEECPSVTEIAVTSAHLRSFAIVCCHNAKLIVLRTQHLRSLHYKGCRPHDLQFIDIPNYDEVAALTIDICDDLTGEGSHEVAPVMELISRCKKLSYLHLALRPSMTCYNSEFTAVTAGLPRLRQLVLKGFMATEHAIWSVTRLIANTQQLEVLTLFPLDPKRPKTRIDYYTDDDSDSDTDTESCFIQNGDDHNYYVNGGGHGYGNGDGHNYGNGDGHDYGNAKTHKYRNSNGGHDYDNGNGHNQYNSNAHNHYNRSGHNHYSGNGHNHNRNGHNHYSGNGHDYDDDDDYFDDDGDYDDEDYDDGHNYDDGDNNGNGDSYGVGDDCEMYGNMWKMGIPCSSHSLTRITIAKYRGTGLDRILANFLLSKGRALEEFVVTLSAQLYPHKEEIAMKFRSWLCNPNATITCR